MGMGMFNDLEYRWSMGMFNDFGVWRCLRIVEHCRNEISKEKKTNGLSSNSVAYLVPSDPSKRLVFRMAGHLFLPSFQKTRVNDFGD
ncbi:hypothetical protein CEXT_491351 [Caerostris extrusa]|uniref:Uncharacterized protein n=1 Tax=Caerostris extrusa TaxID=172846 RepID=A0AAV4SVK7_CAEEX|nr:hypothetical protein CEXT_491351 [Caerostris extrusa]